MDRKAGASLGEELSRSPRSEHIHAALNQGTTSVISACRVKGTQSEEFRSLPPRARYCLKNSTSSSIRSSSSAGSIGSEIKGGSEHKEAGASFRYLCCSGN